MGRKPESKNGPRGQQDKRTTPYQSLLNEKMTPAQVEQKLGIEPALPPIARLPNTPRTPRSR